jgi:hypothetical protein
LQFAANSIGGHRKQVIAEFNESAESTGEVNWSTWRSGLANAL